MCVSISPASLREAPKSRRPWLVSRIKHDGFRLIVPARGQARAALTRNGHDWSDRYPLIVEAALKLRKTSFVIDGEAVVLGPDGISDFRRNETEQTDSSNG